MSCYMLYHGMFDKVSQSLFTSILHAYNKLKCKKASGRWWTSSRAFQIKQPHHMLMYNKNVKFMKYTVC